MKTCTGCKLELPPADFGLNRGAVDGLDKYCRRCRREKYLERKAEGKVYSFDRRPCENCGTEYQPKTRDQKYCSVECRWSTSPAQTRPCDWCGVEYRTKGNNRRLFCSRTCWRASSGEGSINQFGYIVRYVGKDHPGARPDGRILEHRLVMQTSLGRSLEPDETVHHINGDKLDNRPENLQLRSGRHGKGVVLACLDCGSQNVGHVPLANPSPV